MAIYHCSVSMISRGKGRSAVGASAYRSGEKITNEYDGITHDYTNKKGIEYTEIILSKNAPKEFNDRKILWNEVEKSETRINSQTAREVEVALPKELTREEQIYLLKDYVQENFVKLGMCADIAIHDKKDGNPHAHIMLTTREVDSTGFTKKNRDWNNKANLEKWRKSWAEKTNERLLANNIQEKISHLSLEEQGIERIPQIHVGVTAAAIAKKGKVSKRFEINREIIKENQLIEKVQQEIQNCSIQHNDVQKNIEYLEKAKLLEKKELRYEEIEKQYISLKKENILEIQEHNKAVELFKEEKSALLDIAKAKESFEKMEKERSNLIAEKKSLKPWNFNKKNEIELKIEKYNKAMKQAESNFKKNFEIDIKDEESISKIKDEKDTNIQLYEFIIINKKQRITKNQEEIKNLELELGISLDEKKPVEKKGIFANLEEIKSEKKNLNNSLEKNKRKNFDRER